METSRPTRKSQVGVWGGGYLGYTFALRLQQADIPSRVWVQDEVVAAGLRQGTFPGKDLEFAWSRTGSLPQLDRNLVDVTISDRAMFDEFLPVHIVALPNRPHATRGGVRLWEDIADFIRRHLPEGERIDVILAALPVPGDTEAFLRRLGPAADRVRVATAFRTDWLMEDFIQGSPRIPVSMGDDVAPMLGPLFSRLGLKTHRIGSHYEAEVFSVVLNGLEYLASAYVNQMAIAHPGCNFQRIGERLLEHVRPGSCRPSLGVGGRKAMVGLEYAIDGSIYSGMLGLLNEAQKFSMSLPIMYADYLSRHLVRRVGILGITPQPDLLDLALSPSLVLAEALMGRNIEVYVHDPHYSHEAVQESLAGVRQLNMNTLADGGLFDGLDAVVLMTPHRFYREFTQADIDALFNGAVGILIDNWGGWSRMRFDPSVSYHAVGDGTMDVLG